MVDAEQPAVARQKFACPACGAEAQWNPGKGDLVCPFCGTVSPVTLQTRGADTVIVEHDLVAALRQIPDAKRGCNCNRPACQNPFNLTMILHEAVEVHHVAQTVFAHSPVELLLLWTTPNDVRAYPSATPLQDRNGVD